MDQDQGSEAKWLQVPAERLSAEALEGLVEEFASREGTDYGEREVGLDAKVAQIRHMLERGDCVIVFDEDSASCQIVTREALEAGQLQAQSEGDDSNATPDNDSPS